jgi:hypothetical protein
MFRVGCQRIACLELNAYSCQAWGNCTKRREILPSCVTTALLCKGWSTETQAHEEPNMSCKGIPVDFFERTIYLPTDDVFISWRSRIRRSVVIIFKPNNIHCFWCRNFNKNNIFYICLHSVNYTWMNINTLSL